MKSIIPVFALLVSGALSLPGYATAQTCRKNCQLEIKLPKHIGYKPEAPDVYRIQGGIKLDFLLTVPDPSDPNTEVILSFEKPIVRDPNGGDWLFTVELEPGSNIYTVRPFDDWMCHWPEGCKYVIINLSNPERPSWIHSPDVIIDPD